MMKILFISERTIVRFLMRLRGAKFLCLDRPVFFERKTAIFWGKLKKKILQPSYKSYKLAQIRLNR